MTQELLLLSTAVTVGALHTAVGVDHTLPFVALSRARNWSLRRTLAVTFACGLGHVLSSVLVGTAGVLLGITTHRLQSFEALRGNFGAWLLIAFGSVYALVGVLRMLRGSRHVHVHVHPDGTVHAHGHDHAQADGRVVHSHLHRFGSPSLAKGRLVPALIVIFLLGPCEALLPLMFAPAASGHLYMPWLVAGCFSLATVVTMLVLVACGCSAIAASERLNRHLARLEPHLNWAAGVAIALSGVLIEVLDI
jgi:ABC-type nickel/cobalt efflux system permease component RcnA